VYTHVYERLHLCVHTSECALMNISVCVGTGSLKNILNLTNLYTIVMLVILNKYN
jgi:hypothetical protein